MKVLFLDVDGVLNSAHWFRQHPAYLNDMHAIDPAAVKLVYEICDRTGAVIVLSSTWRIVPQLVTTLRTYFNDATHTPIVDLTPVLMSSNRGEEIAAWLRAHPDVTDFAIVDDDEDAGDCGLVYRFVRTRWSAGLTAIEADKLIRLLGGASYFAPEHV